jgi:hypothetical protein
MDLRGNEGWEKAPEKKLETTDWPHKECLSYVKSEALPSGTELVRGLYFYPPPAPSPAIFPTLSGQELIKGCVLAMVRVEARSSSSDFDPERIGEARAAEFGHPLDQAVRERFTKKYGESVGMKNVAFWGPGSRFYEDAARWIPHAEIVSGYDPLPHITFPSSGRWRRPPLPRRLPGETEMLPWRGCSANCPCEARTLARRERCNTIARDWPWTIVSETAKDAWSQAWHLAAGLLPTERYVCFGD